MKHDINLVGIKPQPRITLPNRQSQVVYLLSIGHSFNSAAAALGISPRTVRFHVELAKQRTFSQTIPQLVTRFVLSNLDKYPAPLEPPSQ